MTSATAAILSAIQKDAFVWQRKNFGEPNALVMLCGVFEEYGESCEAMGETEAWLDGVADSFIYLCQFCSILGWDVGELWQQRELFELPSRPWPILVGRISHSYVKGRVSHYRGTTEEHDVRCRAAISALLKYWEKHLADMGRDFCACVEKVWREVAARDWTPETKASAPAGDLPSVCDTVPLTDVELEEIGNADAEWGRGRKDTEAGRHRRKLFGEVLRQRASAHALVDEVAAMRLEARVFEDDYNKGRAGAFTEVLRVLSPRVTADDYAKLAELRDGLEKP
jgi:hypothetical protein